jgi:uncharacterized iron-regulated membrane protein
MLQNHQELRPWVRTTGTLFILGLLIALLSVGLAACGYGGISISSMVSQAQIAQPQARTQVQTKIKNCGTVAGLGRLEVPVNDTGATAAESCFWRAFQNCQPAMLAFIMSSIDTSLIRTFVIHKNRARCSITDARQFRVVPRPLSPAQVFTCAGLTKLPGALRFNACGKDGNVVLPG